MAKNRRKKRRKNRGKQAAVPRPQLPRPSGALGREVESRPSAAVASPAALPAGGGARPSGPGSEGTVVGTVIEVEREFIWIDVGAARAKIYASELMLGIGERPADRYAIGDHFEAFIFQMDPEPESGAAQFSIRRASPYPEALADLEVGSEAQATVVNTYDLGIELDIGGVRGNIFDAGLPLSVGETTHERYQPGGQITARIHAINVQDRELVVSARQYAPGYVEALKQRTVGDVVSGTIMSFGSDGSLWLDINGLVASVGPRDLDLANGETARDRYSVGDHIDGLFVWQINHEARDLALSVKRNAPDYVEALQRRAVGEVASATVIDFWGNGGLWLDVGGLVGAVGPQELDLADGESAQDRYAVGATVDGLFVWQIDHEDRSLILSAKRNTPSYVEALQRHAVGEVVSATVTGFQNNGGLWLDVDGLIGAVLPWELDLDDGESTQDRYAVGETIDSLFVWQINHETRDLFLSTKRNTPGYAKALDAVDRGDEIDCIVTEANEWGVWLDAAGVVGWIPASELLLDDGESPSTRYTTGDKITARVWQIDHEARDIVLSVRRLEADFPEETITRGAVIDAVVRGTTSDDLPMPIRVLANNHEVWIPAHELAVTIGVSTQFKDGDVIRPIVTDMDEGEDNRPARLSLRRALDGWDSTIGRLSAPNFLVPNARIVPHGAVTKAELRDGSAAVDLGPILGLISQEELDLETGKVLMEQSSNRDYGVVIDSVDREHGFACVSHERFGACWRDVAEQLELEGGAEVEGELRDFNGEIALLDLGSGLLAQMPTRELPDSDPPGKAARDRIGEPFPLRITTIDRDKQTVHVEPRDQWVESLIGEPESETLEFKEVLRGDPDADDAKEMTRQAMRTINAFLNTEGGHLIIGVHDTTREVVGLEGDPGLDAGTIEKKIDQATQILETNLANLEPRDLLRDDLDDLVTWDIPSVRGGTLLMITCKRGPDAGVNLVIKGKPEFWVRERSSKKQLRTQSEIRDHLRTRQQRAATAGNATADD